MPNLILNFIKKIEFELNFKVAELEFEPKPCDIGFNLAVFYIFFVCCPKTHPKCLWTL